MARISLGYAEVLHLVTVDGFHVERVAQHKFDLFPVTKIGQPVPREHTFHPHNQSVTIRCNQIQKMVAPRLQIAMHQYPARLIDNADVHFSGMQVDSAVE